MKKITCKTAQCDNKDITYFMPIEDEKVLCGGCKTMVDAVTMTTAEIATTFDYDFNAPFPRAALSTPMVTDAPKS
jgi:hypothetical protein